MQKSHNQTVVEPIINNLQLFNDQLRLIVIKSLFESTDFC